MDKTVLITGGAGFIGSHLADELLARGYRVRALDCLSPQVHGNAGTRPDYLAPDVELMIGDVRDRAAVERALTGVDAVFHFAARVGVGQSMYRMADYVETNVGGTAVLLEALAREPVEKLVVASSMSIYGEGLYQAGDGTFCSFQRSEAQLRQGDFALRDSAGRELQPVPTPESKAPAIASIYAMSKHDQEQMCLMAGRAYQFPVTALRFFNVYGPRQALSNPYTGVLAIFAARLLNGNPPLVFEDGRQRRDFIHVHDIARACVQALERPEANGAVFNIGSGRDYTIREIAERTAAAVGRAIAPEITGRYRVGDIRNCFADITAARQSLGFEPAIDLSAGLTELAEWLSVQSADDRAEQAQAELRERGLTV